jgi:hypothetical protein
MAKRKAHPKKSKRRRHRELQKHCDILKTYRLPHGYEMVLRKRRRKK